MTWVIGASTPFGYGFAISDIRVKLLNGDTYDILQKIYPVGNYILAGFSGSVRIGFNLIESLSGFLKLPPKGKNAVWHPGWVAENWSQEAKRIFLKYHAEEQKLGSAILLVGVLPDKENNVPMLPKIARIILKAPHFTPCIYQEINDISNIGSGSGVSEYIRALKHYLSIHKNPFLKSENASHGGWGSSIAVSLSHTIRDNRDKGISEHLHIGIVMKGGIEIRKNDHLSQKIRFAGVKEIVVTEFPLPLSSQTSDRARIDHPNVQYLRMPRTAKSWQDFGEMLKSQSQKASGAIC